MLRWLTCDRSGPAHGGRGFAQGVALAHRHGWAMKHNGAHRRNLLGRGRRCVLPVRSLAHAERVGSIRAIPIHVVAGAAGLERRLGQAGGVSRAEPHFGPQRSVDTNTTPALGLHIASYTIPMSSSSSGLVARLDLANLLHQTNEVDKVAAWWETSRESGAHSYHSPTPDNPVAYR